jgi:hypothetical protein
MHRLLAAWTELGFFEAARPSVPPQTKAALTLRIGDQQWVRARLPAAAAGVDDAQQFAQCAEAFRFVYDSTQSWHTARNVSDTDFDNASRRLERLNQEAIERHQGRQ